MHTIKNCKLESVEKLKMKNEDGSVDENAQLYKLIFQEQLEHGFTNKHMFYVNKPEINFSELIGKNFDVNFNVTFSQEAKIRGKKAVIVETEKVKFASATQID